MASWISSFLQLSSYVHPYLESSKTLSWYLELSTRPPIWLQALFIAPASNRWQCDPDSPAPPHTVSPTFLAAPLEHCYTPLLYSQWRQQTLVYVCFKGRVLPSNLLFSSQRGKTAELVPNSPCFTPTFVRDTVPIFLSITCFFPHYRWIVKALRRGTFSATR